MVPLHGPNSQHMGLSCMSWKPSPWKQVKRKEFPFLFQHTPPGHRAASQMQDSSMDVSGKPPTPSPYARTSRKTLENSISKKWERFSKLWHHVLTSLEATRGRNGFWKSYRRFYKQTQTTIHLGCL